MTNQNHAYNNSFIFWIFIAELWSIVVGIDLPMILCFIFPSESFLEESLNLMD